MDSGVFASEEDKEIISLGLKVGEKKVKRDDNLFSGQDFSVEKIIVKTWKSLAKNGENVRIMQKLPKYINLPGIIGVEKIPACKPTFTVTLA